MNSKEQIPLAQARSLVIQSLNVPAEYIKKLIPVLQGGL